MDKEQTHDGVGLTKVFASCSIGLDERRILSASITSCNTAELDDILKNEEMDEEAKAAAFYLRNAIGYFETEAQDLVEKIEDFLKKLNA